jgi:Zn-dependent M28 family amino/carboxypeptidase
MQHAVAQMQWVPRHPGTEGARLCGVYILAQLAELGWATEEQSFTYRDTPCRNLIGKRGSGPVLIIGAHYDTRRRADRDPDPAKRDLPVPGANDGASGVAVLLELARILEPETLGRTIWLTAFDAEDNGSGGIEGWDWIVGSRYMAQNLEIRPQGMVLVDMIGDADLQIYYERNSTAELREGIWQVAADLEYSAFIPQEKYSILDDHIPFLEQGIPAVNLIDFDYPFWHTIADTLDKISAASLESVGRTLHSWLLRGAPGLPLLPASTTIHLPLITTYAFDNVSNDELWLA